MENGYRFVTEPVFSRARQVSAIRDIRLVIVSVCLGALFMYFTDSRTGRRRRALLADRLVHAEKVIGNAPRVIGRDLLHRARGLWAQYKRWLGNAAVSDAEVAARVRAKLGRFVSHPHAVESTIHDGRVTLSGPILEHEIEPLLHSICRVDGVRDVENRLRSYDDAAHIPALQGGVPRAGERFELMQERWSPAARVLMSGVGAGLIAQGLRAGGVLGCASAVLGGALVARCATNRGTSSLLGIGEEARGFHVDKTVHVAASPQTVFRFFTDFTNFPRFMSRVRHVELLDDRRSRWTVEGPAGLPVHWTAEITKIEPDALIEWRAEPGSAIRHQGSVRFDINSNGGTRIQIRLDYLPPAGVLGHAVASFFAVDPKSEMDEELMRLKSTLETGRFPHDTAQRVSRHPVK